MKNDWFQSFHIFSKSLKLEINRLKKALKDKENKLPKDEQQENTVTKEIRKQPVYMNKQEAIHPKGILNNGSKEITQTTLNSVYSLVLVYTHSGRDMRRIFWNFSQGLTG